MTKRAPRNVTDEREGGKITELDVVADPAKMRHVNVVASRRAIAKDLR